MASTETGGSGSQESGAQTAPVDAGRAARISMVRQAYERGRLQRAFRNALVVLPLLAIPLATCGQVALPLCLGLALFVAALVLKWRGQSYGRAASIGLFAGSLPLVLPLVLRGGGHCCLGGACFSMCMAGCVLGGFIAGAMVGVMAVAERKRWTFLFSGGALVVLTGAMGCVAMGAAGIVGMAAGMVAGAFPLMLIGTRRNR